VVGRDDALEYILVERKTQMGLNENEGCECLAIYLFFHRNGYGYNDESRDSSICGDHQMGDR
jgi:hypothetical protein